MGSPGDGQQSTHRQTQNFGARTGRQSRVRVKLSEFLQGWKFSAYTVIFSVLRHNPIYHDPANLQRINRSGRDLRHQICGLGRYPRDCGRGIDGYPGLVISPGVD